MIFPDADIFRYSFSMPLLVNDIGLPLFNYLNGFKRQIRKGTKLNGQRKKMVFKANTGTVTSANI